jgi:hypothetical protein
MSETADSAHADSAWALKRDAELAAKSYQKPGRSKKERG